MEKYIYIVTYMEGEGSDMADAVAFKNEEEAKKYAEEQNRKYKNTWGGHVVCKVPFIG